MSDGTRLYTPAEAGAISGLKLKAVHNAIDKRIVDPVIVAETSPRRAPRYLTGEDLVRLRVWRGVGDNLSADRRKRLFAAIVAQPRARTIEADDLLIVDVGKARKQIDKGLRDLEAAERLVVKDRGTLGGEPVFKGTRIPVHGVVAMLEAGATPEDLLSGYPKLTPRRLDLARIWASAHPRRGRPRLLSEWGFAIKSRKRVPRRGDPLARPTAAPIGG